MSSSDYPQSERAEAVRVFNARFGEMERALWCLSVNARASLLAEESSPVLEALVWTLKSWWSVQFVKPETKTLMAGALTKSVAWRPQLFEPQTDYGPRAVAYACECLDELVSRCRSLGVERREYCLAAKVLHWLMPWRMPVYDSFVRSFLRVPGDGSAAYRKITMEIFETARKTAGESDWIGTVPPRSPLRAFDKFMWMRGGGATAKSVVVRDPWAIVHRLRLSCPCPRCRDYDDGWRPAPLIDTRAG